MRSGGSTRVATIVTIALIAAGSAACRGSSKPTLASLLGSLPKESVDKPAGPFIVGHVPSGHVADTVTRGTAIGYGGASWCLAEVCASRAFSDWRKHPTLGVDRFPKGSYAVVFDAPAPRVDDRRSSLLPTGTTIDVSMLPGSRADLAIGAQYNVMADSDFGEEGPAQDVWFDRRVVRVGTQDAVLTESYGVTDGFPIDTKTLYFEGPHGELGVARATANIFFGTTIWSRITGNAARIRAARRGAARQQISDHELIAVAASVRATTGTGFTLAANRVADGRICTLDLQHKNTHDERVIASGTLALLEARPDGSSDQHQVWTLRQGLDATNHATCPRDDTTCPKQLGPCLEWQPYWGDMQRSPAHSVYYEFASQNGPALFALAPGVRMLRVTTLTGTAKKPIERVAATVPTFPGRNTVRWALSPVRPYRLTALDAAGRALETVRVDLSGP